MYLLVTHGRSCVKGSEWLVLQVALLHTWVGEDQCRVNPLERYYLSHTHWDIIIIIIIINIIIITEIEFPLGGSSPYTSGDKTNKNKYT